MEWSDLFLTIIGIVLLIIFLFHKSYMWLMIDMDHDRIVRMRETAGIARYYYCAVMQSFYKKKGEFYTVYNEQLDEDFERERTQLKYKYKILGVFHPPETEKMYVKDCYTLHKNLHLYRQCIDFNGHHTQVPPLVLTSYFNKPVIALGSSIHSRTRILGVIHTHQEVTVYQDLRPLLTGFFTMSLNAIEYRKTERGIEVDVRSCIYDEHDILVWEGLGSGINLNESYKPGKHPSSSAEKVFKPYKEEFIPAHKDLGWKFAQATTDWQPQHLSTWTARIVGFKKPIAHGLWMLAASVERIMRTESCYQQVYPLHIEAKFRKPLELGSTALLRFEKPEGNKRMSNFKLVRINNPNVPYLEGRLYVGAKEPKA